MSTDLEKTDKAADKTALTIQGYLNTDKVKGYLDNVLKDRAPQFIASLVSLSNLTPTLAQAEPRSLMMCGLKAASLNLPLDNNLGFAYAIPYKNNSKQIIEAQFQIGYKGFIQMGMRTGQYKVLNVIDIREGELVSWDPFTEELVLKMISDVKERNKTAIMGYAAIFVLINGFSKKIYKDKDTILAHGKRFSRAYKAGPWQTDEEPMCKKTLIKELLSKWGPLSTELQEAVKFDQAIIRETPAGEVIPDYVDAPDRGDVAQIDYGISEAEMTELTELFDTLDMNSAQREMELGQCKGDPAAVTALKEKLKERLRGGSPDQAQELFDDKEKLLVDVQTLLASTGKKALTKKEIESLSVDDLKKRLAELQKD